MRVDVDVYQHTTVKRYLEIYIKRGSFLTYIASDHSIACTAHVPNEGVPMCYNQCMHQSLPPNVQAACGLGEAGPVFCLYPRGGTIRRQAQCYETLSRRATDERVFCYT